MSVRFYVVDGLIGSGKTSLLDELEKLGYTVERQPIEKWTLLAPFYENPAKFAMALQIQVLASYLEIIRKHKYPFTEDGNDKIVFLESYALASVNTFGKLLRDDNLISSSEFTELNKMIHDVRSDTLIIQQYFFVKTSIDKCMERIAKRGRPGETVSREYQKKLKSKYHDFMDHHEQWAKVRYVCNETDGNVAQLARHIVERYIKKNKKLMRVAICGNIGSGKSTFLEEVAKFHNKHPVRQLITPNIAKFLKLKYEGGVGTNVGEKKEITFRLQLEFVRMYAQEMVMSDPTLDSYWEGVLSLIAVFSRIAYTDDFIDFDHWTKIMDEYERYGLPKLDDFDLVVYLKPSFNEIQRRIGERGREGEEGISLSYLKKIHERYVCLFELFKGPYLEIDNTGLSHWDVQKLIAEKLKD